MTDLRAITVTATDLEALKEAEGRVAVCVTPEGKLSPGARRLNRLSKGALARAVESAGFEKAKTGDVMSLAWPAGMAAEAIDVVKLPRRPSVAEARKAGAALAKVSTKPALVLAESLTRPEDLAAGLALRAYGFTDHKTEKGEAPGAVTLMVSKPDEVGPRVETALAVAEGVVFTRDLVSEPANVLTTTEFATRLEALRDLGVEVEVIEEDRMAELGMGAYLSVSQGSESPAKFVIMRWKGGEADAAPLALVGKGVVFDTGGISLKPAAGMEDMTMDMGGAGTVAGVMKALARRKARANVTGLVGIVENMPDGRASRPGDIVRSMKGETIEIINTDAEGRLVLADVLWYAQEYEKPAAMIDLATLTGACIIALGHENAAYFANDEDLSGAFSKAAAAEGEGVWRLPFGPGYAEQIKTPLADIKNTGGRAAGTITAAEFLKVFVKEETPWIHIDIAGMAKTAKETPLAPKGASGWGVMALNRLVADRYEG
ncbi:leucyl aminopeptidase [Roseivivax sp. GX 12232]|uniref:leucyl aminopeptidase n=1 Tax=Roseivivax sp. GX 12232 TaxID=2900547 RepID=UPI001E366B33|nr:leucyl aminopeptidase [Roseivivax sp. GX 12232]MCE0504596.1 leucyl aminopeptidase [Roseivivax sp. GX 12232]